ncbi:hypothetical protein Tco_0668532 [Tanacetum coccineum]
MEPEKQKLGGRPFNENRSNNQINKKSQLPFSLRTSYKTRLKPWIREIIGEHDNILPSNTNVEMEITDDEDNGLYDDGSEFELFQGDPEDEGDENFLGKGGWIKDNDNNCNSSSMSS